MGILFTYQKRHVNQRIRNIFRFYNLYLKKRLLLCYNIYDSPVKAFMYWTQLTDVHETVQRGENRSGMVYAVNNLSWQPKLIGP